MNDDVFDLQKKVLELRTEIVELRASVRVLKANLAAVMNRANPIQVVQEFDVLEKRLLDQDEAYQTVKTVLPIADSLRNVKPDS